MLKDIVEECFGEVAAEIEEESDRVIESLTEFSDLGFEGQDIVDTGRLLNSKEVNATNSSIRLSWSPRSPENGYPYAPAIVKGFFAFGKKYIPGRNFPVRSVQNVDPVNSLADKLREKGLKVKVKSNNVSLL